MPKKLTIEFVREEFAKRGYDLLEDVYINAITKMRYKCPRHPDKDLSIFWSNFQQGRGCKYCGYENASEKNTLDIAFVKDCFIQRGYILLEDVYINCSNPMKFECPHHPNEDLYITWSTFNKGSGCVLCGRERAHLSTTKEEKTYIEQLSSVNNTIILIGKYKTTSTKTEHKCLICNYIWSPTPNSLINGKTGCPCCSNSDVVVGINSIWDTNPELAKLLVNPEDGYKYSQFSSQKVDWKCPNCDNIIKNKTISVVSRNKLVCNICSDGISLPEKFMSNVLKQLNINFNYNICLYKHRKRYDFYIKNLNCIIETHGMQHYEEGPDSSAWSNLIETQKNDQFKYQLAIENGIANYIVIDCRYSDLNYIKNSILNSKLKELFDLSNINWEECFKNSFKSYIIEACELWNIYYSTKLIAEKMKLSQGTITRYLKNGAKVGLCNYDSSVSRRSIVNNNKAVVCLTTKEIFKSIHHANKIYNTISRRSISKCCNYPQHHKYAGKDVETGEVLRWCFLLQNYIKIIQ